MKQQGRRFFSAHIHVSVETSLVLSRERGPGGEQRGLVTITEKWGEGGATVTQEQLPGLVITILG